MPRAPTTSASRPRKAPTGGKTPPCPPLRFRCTQEGCPWSYARQSDLKRHMPRHMSSKEKEQLLYRCEEPGCTHHTLQKSNMETHYIAKHTALKPHICDQCSYSAADPSCLYKHMRAIHGYVPGTERRKSKAPAPSASSPESTGFAASTHSSDYSQLSTGSWDVSPSPMTSTDSLPSPLAYSPTAYDDFTSYSPATFDPLFYPTAFSPSSIDSSLPASPTSDAWLWDPTFERVCQLMGDCSGIVAPTAAPGPATLYPAESLELFALGDGASASFPECLDVMQPEFNDVSLMSFPPLLYDPSFELLSSSFDLPGLNKAFEGEWSKVVY
ncbi:hypothetical protein C8R44DRAFT_915769 [Mycena epipterygia]|nr:hypothetical protein C8R44DRAFT_915769 [Mycena epipterygia]